MKNKYLLKGATLLMSFALWTFLIQVIDVKPIGIYGTNVGFSTINQLFHQWTGVHHWLYNITDWLGLIPIIVCFGFAILGLFQLIKRKSLLKVDIDIILLGAYYLVVVAFFIGFEIVPINYRPILIEGVMEASYPSSTTLLVLSVTPTLAFQVKRKLKSSSCNKAVYAFTYIFCALMVIGRLYSGVHWLTDIIGGILLSTGLFYLYIGTIEFIDNKTIN